MYYRYARMGSYSLCIMACLGLFLSLSCAPSFARKSNLPKFTLTKKDSGKTITLRVGDKIAIKLAETPSTNYLWDIEQTDSNILKCLGSKYVQDPLSSEASGNRTFLFQALKPGTVHLKLKQWRLWESIKPIIGRFNAVIKVAHAH
jgi:predicted secreted protein